MSRLREPRSIVELVGAVGVVASLVFVGVEIRQNSEAARAATAQQVVDGWLYWNMETANVEIWTIIEEASLVGGPSELSYPKRMALGSFLRGMFHNWSIAHYHYLKGNLDAALWRQQLDDMAGFPNSDWSDIRWWGWDLWGFLYTPAFREVMDSVREAEREAATGG